MDKEIMQKDLIFVEEAEKSVSNKLSVPPGYIEIKLNSLGLLSAPRSLFFRNYSMEEAIELSMITEENAMEKFLNIFNRMVYGGFNCENLVENELVEIAMTLYANFWSPVLKNMPYIKDESLPFEGDNIGYCDVPISRIETKPLPENYKEPFFIELDNTKVWFKIPRLKDILFCKELVNQNLYNEEKALSDRIHEYKQCLKENKDVSKFEDVLTFNEKKLKMYLKYYACSYLEGIGDKFFDTFEKKLESFDKVDIRFWKIYDTIMKTKLNFGVQNKVKLIDEGGQTVVRNFQFQFFDFIPNMELEGDTKYKLSF